MESRLQQLSISSSPTSLIAESPSRLRASSNNKIVSNRLPSTNTAQASFSQPPFSAQTEMSYNVLGGTNLNNPNRISSNERTYINVNPVAYVSRQGITVNPTPTQLPIAMNPPQSEACNHPQVPAIPRSQVVKKFVEPSYSTILQPDRDAIILCNDQTKNSNISSL